MAKSKVSRIGAPLSKDNEGPDIKPQMGTRGGPGNVVGPAHIEHRFLLGGLPPALAQARDEETSSRLGHARASSPSVSRPAVEAGANGVSGHHDGGGHSTIDCRGTDCIGGPNSSTCRSPMTRGTG